MELMAFNPWRPDTGGSEWALPERRPKQVEATALLGGIGEATTLAACIGRSVVLGRRLRQCLPLEPLPDLKPRELLRDLAEKFAQEIGEEDAAHELSAPMLHAVSAEMAFLKHEAGGNNVGSDGDLKEMRTRTEGCAAEGYREFVLGLHERLVGGPTRALKLYQRALELEGSDAGRAAILCEVLESRWSLRQIRKVETDGAALIKLCEALPHSEFELSVGHHFRALSFHERQMWLELVEAGRDSNFNLFRFGGVQASRRIGVNTFLTAKGMAQQHEWSEASLLAGLSLKALHSWTEWPTKTEAAFLLAEGVRRFDRAGALKVLARLIDECPETPEHQATLDRAKELQLEWSSPEQKVSEIHQPQA